MRLKRGKNDADQATLQVHKMKVGLSANIGLHRWARMEQPSNDRKENRAFLSEIYEKSIIEDPINSFIKSTETVRRVFDHDQPSPRHQDFYRDGT